MGDHTETIEIDFDPSRITYRDLLDVFFKSHNPTKRSWSVQYRSAVFYQDEDQRQEVTKAIELLEEQIDRKVRTDIEAYTGFTMAEDYHQKYILKNSSRALGEMQVYYPDPADLVNSTAAARINGYLGDNGRYEQLQSELQSLGLSDKAQKRLLGIVRK
jgi:peptide methionine sulfoxide reductase MsrA